MIENNPLVSVIIPSYNHEQYIEKSIQSVINQSYENIEIIIVDDASTDNTCGIIEKFNDTRMIKVYRRYNLGGVINLNKGIEQAKGKYIAILNSDDYWHVNKLEIQVAFLESNSEYGAVFSNCEFIDERGNFLTRRSYLYYDIFYQENRKQEEWLRKFFFDQNCICHPSILIHKELYDRVGLYDPRLRQLPDFKMWINILKVTNIYVLDQKLVYFRILDKGKNTSGNTDKNNIRIKNELHLILKEFFKDMPLQLFVRAFEDNLINTNISTPEQMACEQAFLYLRIENQLNLLYRLLAVEQFSDLLKQDITKTILEQQYDFTYNTFFELTGKTNLSTIGKYDIYLKQEMKQLDKILFILKKIRDGFKNRKIG